MLDSKLKTRQFHHAQIMVNDLEKARHFYGEVLGLQELQRGSTSRAGGLWYGIGANELHIFTTDEPMGQGSSLFPPERGREGRHIAFTMDGSLDDICKGLDAAGIPYLRRPGRLPQIFLEDGNGNSVELNTGWEQKPVT